MARSMMARRGTVDFDHDEYSITENLWKSFKEVPPVSTGSAYRGRRRSLLRRGSIAFDYFHKQKTPLMKAVKKNYVKTAFNLLLFNADPNLQHEGTGDTALHLAVNHCNLLLVKALLAFNADTTILNNQQQTPLDIATILKHKKVIHKKESIDAIIEVLTESAKLQAKTLDYFEEHSTVPPPRNSSDTFLLSLDGGGIRVLITTHILVSIEERLSQLTSTEQRLYKYFDYLAGTSCGAMTVCVMAYVDADCYNTRAISSRLHHTILSSHSKREATVDLDLQETMGKDRTMGDIDPRYRVIVTGTLACHTPFELLLMTSYGNFKANEDGQSDHKVWEVCRCAVTAPYFAPLHRDWKVLDGGLMANNPTLDSMAEIIEQGQREGSPVKFGCVLSIGTGIAPEVKNDHIEVFNTSILSMLSMKNISAVTTLVKHFISQTTLSDGKHVTRAQSLCDALGCKYFRLMPQLQNEVTMGTTDEAKLIDMLYTTQMYILDNPELIDNVAKCLLSK